MCSGLVSDYSNLGGIMDIANAVGIAVTMAVFYMAYILFMDHVYTEEKAEEYERSSSRKGRPLR